VKKKYIASFKDKKDWIAFTKQIGDISAKEIDLLQHNVKEDKVPKLDLHGFSLAESNKIVKKFIIESFNHENLNNKIVKIANANLRDGGEGAMYIFLKSNKKFTR